MWNRKKAKGLSGSANVAWSDALTSQVFLVVDSYYRGRRVRETYIPESNSPYIVNRVYIHVSLPVCVCVPLCRFTLVHTGVTLLQRLWAYGSNGFETFLIRVNIEPSISRFMFTYATKISLQYLTNSCVFILLLSILIVLSLLNKNKFFKLRKIWNV